MSAKIALLQNSSVVLRHSCKKSTGPRIAQIDETQLWKQHGYEATLGEGGQAALGEASFQLGSSTLW